MNRKIRKLESRKNKVLKEKPPYIYPKEFELFIHKWFRKLLDYQNFQDYEIREFEFKKFDEVNQHCVDRFTSMAIEIDEPYLEVKITIYPAAHRKYVERGARFLVENIMVHELCHSITETLTQCAYERFISEDEVARQNEKMTERHARLVTYYFSSKGVFDELGEKPEITKISYVE